MIAGFNKKQKSEFFGGKLMFQIAGVFLLIIVVALVFANLKMFQKKQGLDSQIITYQKKIEDIKKSSETLKKEIANSDNVDYLEKLAYEQGMTKTGEKEVIFITPKEKTEAVAKDKNTWPDWLKQSWNWIKSKF
jgi:cell division protein FtsB